MSKQKLSDELFSIGEHDCGPEDYIEGVAHEDFPEFKTLIQAIRDLEDRLEAAEAARDAVELKLAGKIGESNTVIIAAWAAAAQAEAKAKLMEERKNAFVEGYIEDLRAARIEELEDCLQYDSLSHRDRTHLEKRIEQLKGKAE